MRAVRSQMATLYLAMATGLSCLSGAAQAGDAETQSEGHWIASTPSGCMVWSTFPKTDEQVSWTGGCRDGKTAGHGDLVLTVAGQEATRYSGEMKGGKYDGRGKAVFPDGREYDGTWVADDFTGEGTYRDADCEIKGRFEDAQADGEVQETCTDGTRYAGHTRKGNLHGFGVFTLQKTLQKEKIARYRKAGQGAWHGDDYRVAGWWESGALSFVCSTAAQCEAKLADERVRQARERKAGVQPYIRMSRDTGGTLAWSSEPYRWMTHDGQVLRQGVTSKNGHAVVAQQSGVSRYALETVQMRWEFEVDTACWTRVAKHFERCAILVNTVNKFAQEYAEQERAKREQAEAAHQRAVEHYQQQAAANSDELAWLGPLPSNWSDEAYQKKLMDVTDKVKSDLVELKPQDVDLTRFECKSPQQFGAVPDQQAVIDYIAGLNTVSDAEAKTNTWPALVEAARKGNWQARYQVYKALGRRTGDDLVGQYRQLQLLEWLQAQRVGSVYSDFVDVLADSGYFDGNGPSADAPPYVFAALHGSYSSMERVGTALGASDDPKTQAIGKSLRDCAHQAMPVLFAH